jgi:hypothetical protein
MIADSIAAHIRRSPALQESTSARAAAARPADAAPA